MSIVKLFVYSLIINNLLVVTAFASSDVTFCDFSLTLNNPKSDDICNNLPFLNPYNDSRTNLILLADHAKAQQATFSALTSPQSKAPYLANSVRSKISSVPFELTVYDAYLDDLTKTQQNKQDQSLAQLDLATKNFIKQVKQIYTNDPTIDHSSEQSKETLLASPALTYFNQLVKATGLTEQERLMLGVARYILFNNTQADISHYLPHDPSFTAKHFINYLSGTDAFYKGDYNLANKYFIDASQSYIPWIKETATYMLARNLLNKGQAAAYNNWGELALDKVDQTAINNSYAAFQNYLRLYPHGLYANSSHSLLRRVYWLQNNKLALAKSYEHLLATPTLYVNDNSSIKYSLADLILEIDNKIYFNSKPFAARNLVQTPKLLVTYDLLKMRYNQLTLANLTAQKVDFKHHPELYNYLLATYYTYLKPDPEQVLNLLPELTTEQEELTSFQFSQQVLRALALENKGQWPPAEQLWLTLKALAKSSYQAPLIELGLALHYEKTGQIAKAFSKDSAIVTPQLRYILLRQNADSALLKTLINSPDTSSTDKAYMVYLLLYKDLLSSQYPEFLADSSLLVSSSVDNVQLENISRLSTFNLELFSNAIPSHPEYPCPSPIILANVLKLNPYDAKALNCLGEFREHYALPFANYIPKSSLDIHNKTGSLGTNNPTAFGATLYSRLKGYQQLINDPTVAEDDRAYALYKAIRCFSGTGENRCDRQAIPKKERQRWFRLLHTQYPKTLWAKQQTIYW